jgi:hypothetical protein
MVHKPLKPFQGQSLELVGDKSIIHDLPAAAILGSRCC